MSLLRPGVIKQHKPNHPLALCCRYPVSKCRSASIVVTGTVRVKYRTVAHTVINTEISI